MKATDSTIDELAEFAKNYKRLFYETTIASEYGDAPPAVLAFKDKGPRAIVIAPEVDKEYGYLIGRTMRTGYGATAIGFVFDAHYKEYPKGTTLEDCTQRDLQASKREGGGDPGIVECLILHLVDTDGNYRTRIYSYKTGGPGPLQFNERDDIEQDQIGGAMFDKLKAIMEMPLIDCDTDLGREVATLACLCEAGALALVIPHAGVPYATFSAFLGNLWRAHMENQ